MKRLSVQLSREAPGSLTRPDPFKVSEFAHLEIPTLEEAPLSPVKVIGAMWHRPNCCSFTAGCKRNLQARLPSWNTSDLNTKMIWAVGSERNMDCHNRPQLQTKRSGPSDLAGIVSKCSKPLAPGECWAVKVVFEVEAESSATPDQLLQEAGWAVHNRSYCVTIIDAWTCSWGKPCSFHVYQTS